MQRYISIIGASRSDLLRLAAYYCQRVVTSRAIRRLSHSVLLLVLRRRYQRHVQQVAPGGAGTSRHLRDHGYCNLEPLLTGPQCRAMHAYLAAHALQDSRGSGKNFTLDTIPEACKIGDYQLDTVVNCPHVMEIANHPKILRLAVDYLGFTPVISGLSLRWTFPSQAAPDEVQSFHRDCELGSFKVLVYLSDVDADSGPHTYAARSHLDRMPWRLRVVPDAQVRREGREGVTMLGAAGTSFAIDTRGLHKGAIPRKHPRLMLGIQYSLLPCLLFDYAPVRYTGPATLEKYVNRLVVA